MRAVWTIAAITVLLLGEVGPVQGQEGGGLVGRILLAGEPPVRKRLDVTKDKDVCGKREVWDESLVVGPDTGVKHVVVRVVGARGGRFAAHKVEMDQRGCVYTPHVVVVPTSGQVDFVNSDGILHNVHTYSTANPSINKAQPKFKKVLAEKFGTPEIIKVTCDAHPWMLGWVVATDTPFVAVTDETGRFAITDIPPGTYQVEIWHETLGRQVREVSIRPREETRLSLEMARK